MRYAGQVVFSGKPSRSISLKMERGGMLKNAITECVIITCLLSTVDRCDHFEVIFTAVYPHSIKSASE